MSAGAGTGYTARTARELWQRLHPLERETPPFPAGRPAGYVARNLARWVEPKLVCEFELFGGIASTQSS
jgi:bifunctional non-homologous end joining protein LigD